MASERTPAWVLHVLDWLTTQTPHLRASQRRPQCGQLLISLRRNVGVGAGCICVEHRPQPGESGPPAPSTEARCSGQRPTQGPPSGRESPGWGRLRGSGARVPQPADRLTHVSSAPPPAGGFATFSSCFPGLCEGKPAALLPMSLSQPCLPVPSVGLTRILPHLYLGSQKDVLNKVCAQLGLWPLAGERGRSSEAAPGLVWGRKGADRPRGMDAQVREKHGLGARRPKGAVAGPEQRRVEKQLPAPRAAEPTCQTADVTGPPASTERVPYFKTVTREEGKATARATHLRPWAGLAEAPLSGTCQDPEVRSSGTPVV